jgi:hypothetical protein
LTELPEAAKQRMWTREKSRPLHVAVLLAVAAAIASAGPAKAGPPFRTDDPEPVDYQHWEVYAFSVGTRVHGDTSGLLPGIEVNYGAAPNLQLHVAMPLAYDSPSGGGTQFGYGDTELGAKLRLVDEDENGWRPMVGIFPMLELPTGNVRRGLGAGHTREFLPVWIQKSFGDWTTYGGGGYEIKPGTGNKNFWFAGWYLQRKVTDQLSLGGEMFHQTADSVGGRDSTGFNLGGIYDVTEHHHLLFSAGRGIQNARYTNEFSYYLGYQLTF